MAEVKKVDYVILIPGNTFSMQFLHSWTQTIQYLHSKGINTIMRFGYSPVITEIRNMLLSENPAGETQSDPLKPFGGDVTCKKVIFIDSDIIWSTSDFEKLLESDKDVICGIYKLGDGIRSSVSIDNAGMTSVSDLKALNYTEPFQIGFAGLGFVACSFHVLEAMKYPFFEIENLPQILGNTAITGEDALFFNRIRNMGYEVYADPSITLGHLKLTPLTI